MLLSGCYLYAMDFFDANEDFSCYVDFGITDSKDSDGVSVADRTAVCNVKSNVSTVGYLCEADERYRDNVRCSDNEIIANLLKIDRQKGKSWAEEKYEKEKDIEICIAQEKEERERGAVRQRSQNRASRNYRSRKKKKLNCLQDFAELITGSNDPEQAKKLLNIFRNKLDFFELDPERQGMPFLTQLESLFKLLHEKNRILGEANRALQSRSDGEKPSRRFSARLRENGRL